MLGLLAGAVVACSSSDLPPVYQGAPALDAIAREAGLGDLEQTGEPASGDMANVPAGDPAAVDKGIHDGTVIPNSQGVGTGSVTANGEGALGAGTGEGVALIGEVAADGGTAGGNTTNAKDTGTAGTTDGGSSSSEGGANGDPVVGADAAATDPTTEETEKAHVPGSCHDGVTRSCTIDLGARDGVRDCWKGTETCVDGVWGACVATRPKD